MVQNLRSRLSQAVAYPGRGVYTCINSSFPESAAAYFLSYKRPYCLVQHTLHKYWVQNRFGTIWMKEVDSTSFNATCLVTILSSGRSILLQWHCDSKNCVSPKCTMGHC